MPRGVIALAQSVSYSQRRGRSVLLPGSRIVIIGMSGSGKTTLARQLAQQLIYTHVELDALHWEPGWVGAADDVFRARVQAAAQAEHWVADGNYRKAQALLWPRADTIVWLDYSLPVILWRLLRRTVARTIGRQVLWNGNRERFVDQFFSRNSLFVWVLQTYRRRRREYPERLFSPENSHLTVVQLRSPKAARRWLRAQGRG